MYINYNIVNGKEYGTVTASVRKGKSVSKGKQIYLGRVIDKENGIFKNRERGLFKYDLATDSYSSVSADFEEPKDQRKTKYQKRPVLIVSFGDIYLLDSFMNKSGIMSAVNAINYKNQDTLHALVAYYILTTYSNCHAEDWWELTYARYLYPKAQMASQRISDALADIGSEDAKRHFFKEYFKFLSLKKDADESNEIDDGILIDSSGLPNSIHFPLTAVSNHNGIISEELRLIYVVQQHTGMPLFFRYVAGNVIDVSTITRTIAELKANGINTKFAILDAGYYTGVNADALLDSGISFMARMKSNFKVYKRIVSEHLNNLMIKENAVIFNKRLIYIKCVPCEIGQKENRKAYAFLCKDMTAYNEGQKNAIARAEDESLTASDIYDDLQRQGVFVIVSTRKVAVEKILSLYYMRDQVEKIFELCKQGDKILPINVESEATLRGHLMLTFIATVVLKMMSDKLRNTALTTESVFMNLHEQHAIVYDKEFVTTEPIKKMNDAYKAFKIQCPVSIKRLVDNVD